MSASSGPDAETAPAAVTLADARRRFLEIRELALGAGESSVPLIRRDAALIVAMAEQALEFLDWFDVSD